MLQPVSTNSLGIALLVFVVSLTVAAKAEGRLDACCSDVAAWQVAENDVSQASIAAASGDHQKANEFLVEAMEIKTGSEREKSSERIAVLTQRYESENRQRRIDELSRRNEKQMLQQRWLWTIVGGGLLMLMATTVFLLRLRRANHQLEATNVQLGSEIAVRTRLNRAFKLLSDCNMLLVRAKNEHEFLSEICRLVIEEGGYSLAWVGFAEQDEARTVRPVAQAGSEAGYLEGLNITYADTEQGRGPTGTAIRTGKTSVNHDFHNNPRLSPWREAAIERGYQSSISLPLSNHRIFGALSIYSQDPHAFYPEEMQLLEELARDLAYGVETLRVRAEHKQAEETVRQLNANLSATLRAIPDLMFELDGNGTYIDIYAKNPALLAAPKESLIGHTLAEMLPPEAAEISMAALREADEEGYSYGKVIRLDLAEGSRWFELSVAKKGESYGTDTRFICMSRDITERKKMEVALLNSEQEFRTLAENAPTIIMRYDRECRRIYVNPAFEREIGFSKEQALNVRPDTQWPSNVTMPVEEYQSHLREVMETDEPKFIVVGWPVHDKKGLSTQYYDVRIVAEYDSKGRVIGALAMGHNITELKETEKRLQATQAELREFEYRQEMTREDERRHISRELHDELGQLLTAIRMEISVLKLQYEPDDAQFQDKMQRIVALVDRTIRGVRDVVVMLRPEVLERGIVASLEWLTDEFKAQTGISCELHISRERIVLDEEHAISIFRIVQESLTNVARHSGADTVHIALERNGHGYRLKVADNGKGFNIELQKKKSLGLVGIRERVLSLGGELSIDSGPGRGTKLEIYLPL